MRGTMTLRAVWLAIALTILPQLVSAQYTSKPLDPAVLSQEPMRYTGISYTVAGPCSGAVVGDSRVMLSAAHCVFRRAQANPWTQTPEWFLRYSSSAPPALGTGKKTRGYWYFSGYAEADRNKETSWPTAYDLDYMVSFAYEPLAEESAPFVADGLSAVVNSSWRNTVGYPSGLYPSSGHQHKYFMHSNGPWTAECRVRERSYVECHEVSAGPGNSGGPVFAWDPTTQRYYFAGVHVSGLSRSLGHQTDLSGINAMTQEEWSLVNSAIESANKGDPNGGADRGGAGAPLQGARIAVYGNGNTIPSAKTSPSRSDMTDFGSVTGGRTIRRTFTVTNTGTSVVRFSLSKPVSISGRGGRYFRVRSQMPAGLEPNQSLSLTIAFLASPRGRHRATVLLSSDDPLNPSYYFTVQARRS
jgi:hypothetical protein